MERIGNSVILLDDSDHIAKGIEVYENNKGDRVIIIEKNLLTVTIQDADIIPGFRRDVSIFEWKLNWEKVILGNGPKCRRFNPGIIFLLASKKGKGVINADT